MTQQSLNDNRLRVHRVLKEYDSLLKLKEFKRCDELLSEVDPETTPVPVSLAMLVLTHGLEEQLPARALLLDRVKSYLLETRPADAQALLQNL